MRDPTSHMWGIREGEAQVLVKYEYCSKRSKRTVYVAKPVAFAKYVTYAGQCAPKHPAYAIQYLTYGAYVRGGARNRM